MSLPPVELEMWLSWSVSCLIFSTNKMNRMGESKHPRRTPTIVLKNSSGWQLKRTAHWSSHIVPEWLEPVLPLCWSLWWPCHRRARQTLSCVPSWSLWSCGIIFFLPTWYIKEHYLFSFCLPLALSVLMFCARAKLGDELIYWEKKPFSLCWLKIGRMRMQ